MSNLSLRNLLEVLSYSGLLTAFGFSVIAVFTYSASLDITRGFTAVTTILTLLSAIFYRLSSYNQ